MRKIIAALQTSVDGFIEGPEGELDWAMTEDKETWKDVFAMLKSVDTCILGRVMYPEYEQYWMAVLANPGGPLPLSGKAVTKNEIAYARWANKTPHKGQPGKEIYVIGGATLVGSLMNAGLIDEVRLMVNPIVLGRGKALFKDVKERKSLKFVRAKPLKSGKVSLTYRAQS